VAAGACALLLPKKLVRPRSAPVAVLPPWAGTVLPTSNMCTQPLLPWAVRTSIQGP
jgi:hypothetical protein